MKASGGGGVRDKRVPYKLLMERIMIEIELCWLLVELFFMIFYFCFFIAYVILDTSTTTAFEVNGQVRAKFAESAFPNANGEATYFDEISSPNDVLRWFDNVVLPTLLTDRQLTVSGNASEAPPVYQAYLWQKQVESSTTNCVRAPSFLWKTVNKMYDPTSNSETPSCFPAFSPGAERTEGEFPHFNYFEESPLNSPSMFGYWYGSWYAPNGFYSSEINATWLETWPSTEADAISSSTRLFALVGTAYFPSYNFWSRFTFPIEFSNAGRVFPGSPDITSASLSSCVYLASCQQEMVLFSLGTITAILVLLHFLLFLAFQARALQHILFANSGTIRRSAKSRLVEAFWHLLSFFVLADFAQVVLGMITLTYVSQTLWRTRPTENIPVGTWPLDLEYVRDINSGLQLQNQMVIIFGLQVLLFNIQVFKYFPALPCFTLPRRAWEVACVDVFKVFLVYLLAILAFSFSGWLAFYNVLFRYSSFELSFNSAVQAILGEISFAQAAQTSHGQSVFLWFFSLFYIIVFMYVLQALFLSSILDGFRVAFRENEGREFFTEFAGKLLCCCGNGKRRKPVAALNFSAMSKAEVGARLRDWKARKANEDANLISWIQLRDALRGFTHNRLDVSDEEVDSIFRLVDIVHFVDAKQSKAKGSGGAGAEQQPVEEEEAEAEADMDEEKTVHTAVEVVATLFLIKAEEQEFVHKVTSTVREITEFQRKSEESLRGTVEAKLGVRE